METQTQPKTIGTGPYTGLIFPPDNLTWEDITIHTWQCRHCGSVASKDQVANQGDLIQWKASHGCRLQTATQAD